MSTRPRQPRKMSTPPAAPRAAASPTEVAPGAAPASSFAPGDGVLIDGATYVADIVPDGSSFTCEEPFHDTWQMRNTGTSAWGPGYELALAGGDALGAPASVPLPPTLPGETAGITVNFQAPPRPGRFRSTWRCRNAAGVLFGEPVWVDILAVQREHLPVTTEVGVRDKLGVDANRPIDPNTGSISPTVADPGIIGSIGQGWVRLNFVLGPWQNPLDAAQHGGRTWEQAYRAIIDGLRSHGLRIYGLVSHEAVHDGPGAQFRDPPPAGPVSDDWVRGYADNFHAIVRLFHDRVEAFESFNEPDNWTQLGPNDTDHKRNWVHPEWFAIMLQEIAQRVRSDPQTASARLVSGPLQGMDTGNSARGYLQAAYRAGKLRYGWGQNAPVPFDAVGYHLYIAQDPPNPAQDIPAKYNQFMGEVRQVIADEEGHARPIVVSEMGWPAPHGEDRQAECMRLGLRCLLNDPNVALGIWFCTQDWPGVSWGLYRPDGLAPANRKPAFGMMQTLCADTSLVPAAGWLPAPAAPAAPRGLAAPPGPMAAPPPGKGDLEAFWRQHVEQGLARNRELFDELLAAVRASVASGSVPRGPAPAAVETAAAPATAAGLATAAAVAVILNTYWSRLAHATDPATVQQDFDEITRATLAQLAQLATGRRQGAAEQ